ncbi:MAG: hypothetical protein ACFE85_00045 [Candidatus Hodarchaeota archaeon]
MRPDIEKRLHRVGIRLEKSNIKCTLSYHCNQAESCHRCNEFYTKCTIYKHIYFK